MIVSPAGTENAKLTGFEPTTFDTRSRHNSPISSVLILSSYQKQYYRPSVYELPL